eukprot:CAMPEP_0179896904 /NCGR_PEP_ID=MMETSP0982-20121206/36681_1 /TAXON_ID=483367 /ORGANISM="non described non described, Strain CCMP 2436" /LENGTH=67 /DNA_ID=CAMNT_0021793819 /DNA_START=15 /DNA_END=214 /DNA_ORIENTATION=-
MGQRGPRPGGGQGGFRRDGGGDGGGAAVELKNPQVFVHRNEVNGGTAPDQGGQGWGQGGGGGGGGGG